MLEESNTGISAVRMATPVLSHKGIRYSAKSHYLLNNFTLTIRDAVMQADFTRHRAEHFISLFWPLLALVTGSFVIMGIVELVKEEPDGRKLFGFVPMYATLMFWALCKKLNSRHAPLAIFIYIGTVMAMSKFTCLLTEIAHKGGTTHDQKVLCLIMCFTGANFNSFLQTLVVLPLIILPFYAWMAFELPDELYHERSGN